MRPGEVVQMRMGDLDRAGRVWLYRPQRHKLEHQGADRVIPLGPQAQAVLAAFVRLDPLTPCFSPKEAERERRKVMRAARRTKVWPSHTTDAIRKRKGWGPERLRDTYDSASYRRAVDRACKAAGIASWSPNQLRHSAATRIRKELGLEVAQAVLGHRQLETTQVYAEINVARAVEAMERLG
jgi:integrase